MKVYVVTEGAYSDFHIEAIFATKKAAQAVVDRKNAPRAGDSYGEAHVQEWEVLETDPKPTIRYLRQWWGYDNDDRSSEVQIWPWDDWRPKAVEVTEGRDPDYVCISGTDKKLVNKVFQDTMARRKAVLAGIA